MLELFAQVRKLQRILLTVVLQKFRVFRTIEGILQVHLQRAFQTYPVVPLHLTQSTLCIRYSFYKRFTIHSSIAQFFLLIFIASYSDYINRLNNYVDIILSSSQLCYFCACFPFSLYFLSIFKQLKSLSPTMSLDVPHIHLVYFYNSFLSIM